MSEIFEELRHVAELETIAFGGDGPVSVVSSPAEQEQADAYRQAAYDLGHADLLRAVEVLQETLAGFRHDSPEAAPAPQIGTGEVFMLANELMLAACQAESESRWDTACTGLVKSVKEVVIKLTELSKGPAAPTIEVLEGATAWISVDERLPEVDGEYLVYGNCTNSGEQVDIAKFDTFGSDPRGPKIFRKHNQPTHWQPLPAAPQAPATDENR